MLQYQEQSNRSGGRARRELSQLGLLLLVCGGLAGCATAPARSSSSAVPPTPAASSAGEYRVQSFDALQITVFQETDLSIKTRVSQSGEINYPLLGTVRVAGLTAAEVQKKLAELLAHNYLVNPQVNVLVEGSTTRRVTVLGQVKSPGTFDIPTDEPLRVLQAIARAGGFTEIAATGRVNVLRSENGHERKILVNVAATICGGDNSQNIELRPGDVVSIPETIF